MSTTISAQDPLLLVESLIRFGRSPDGAVERDLRAAIRRLVAERDALLSDLAFPAAPTGREDVSVARVNVEAPNSHERSSTIAGEALGDITHGQSVEPEVGGK